MVEAKQRRLGQVDEAALNQREQMPVEEGEQKGRPRLAQGESGVVAATPSALRVTLSMQQRSPSAEARGAVK